MADHEQEVEISLSQYVEIVSRRRWIVFAIATLVFGGAAGYAFLTAPIFRASTVLNIEKAGSGSVQGQNGVVEGQDEDYFDTQYRLITSDTALRRTYIALNLAETKDFSRGVEALKAAVTVAPVLHTRLCSVNAESTNPQLAVDISRSLSQYFVEQNLNNQLFMSKDVLDTLQARMKGDDADKVSESLPSVVNNKLVQDIKGQIFTAEAHLADLRMKYTDSHPVILSLKSRLASMRQVLNTEVGNVVQSLKTELSGQLRANNVRVIDLPQLPDRPVRPRKELALIFGLLGGVALGIFTALIVEMLDQTVRTHDDVERRLGLPFMGLIPYSRHKKGVEIYAPLVSSERGLCDYLSGVVADPAELLQKSEIPKLDVICCGPRPPNPAELLNTERLGKFIAWARGRYTRVIVDCPPVFPISDILLWGRHVKPVLFVSRYGRTRVPLIRTACARLRGSGVRILGCVINGAKLSTMSYADGRYYEQYYRDYVEPESTKHRRS